MSDSETVISRLSMLRSEMKLAGYTWYLMITGDCHASETVGDHYKVTEFFSGCTSDNVVFLVNETEAWLWTDGRYFISAAAELDGTGIKLMRSGQDGVPTVDDFLKDNLAEGEVLAFDGRCVRAEKGRAYRKIAEKNGCRIEGRADLAGRVWTDRPPLPSNPVMILPDAVTGASFEEKLERVRAEFMKEGASYLLLSKLDDIMWLCNLRGNDIAYSPVALSYALIGTSTFDLFIQESETSGELTQWARTHRIKLHDYHDVYDYLMDYHFEGPVAVDPAYTSDAMLNTMDEKATLIYAKNPTEMLKACKNPVEIENIRKFYLLDSAAVCRFIFWLKKRMENGDPVSEISAAKKIDSLRAEIPGFIELSFGTISAYNANAAMAHYAPSEEKSARLAPHGFLLVDSGGQYMGATTDETRTIPLGELTPEMKRDFTLVAVSNLALMNAHFAKGTVGSQLDMIAREPLAQYGLDFNHGTGHGVGYILNVHEGPQRISHAPKKGGEAPILPGMITSDEPGIYIEGNYGIRTESITLCVEGETNAFGTFLHFDPLTFIPIDTGAIDTAYMSDVDIERLNRYNAEVREKVAPLLAGEEREWLVRETEPVQR